MEVFGYRKLIAYQKAKEVVKRTYKLLKKFPAEERYAMSVQLRRASVSITSNIAEGINRYSIKREVSFHRNGLWFIDGGICANRDCRRYWLHYDRRPN